MSADIPSIKTARLCIRCFEPEDAHFVLELLNRPSFIRGIADRQVRTVEQAGNYLATGPLASYAQFGHGLMALSLLETGVLIGMAGMLQRAYLDMPDLGYALLQEYEGQGFVHEAATALLQDATQRLQLKSICAIANPENVKSHRVLVKLEFAFQRQIERDDGPILWRFERSLVP